MDDVAKELCLADSKGWVNGIFLKIDEAFVCAICSNTCRDCVELSCDVEHIDEEFVLYCQSCLQDLLLSNGNKCPINGHLSPSISISRSSRSRILKSQVICPNSIMYRQNIAKNGINNTSYEHSDQEGNAAGHQLIETPLGNSPKKKIENGCSFTGKLSKLIRHINMCCITQAVSNPELQSRILQNMKSTTKLYSERVKTVEASDLSSVISSLIGSFHEENNPKLAANDASIKQLQLEFSSEQKLQNEIEININNNKQEIQELKDLLSAMKRSFNNYKSEQSFIDYKAMLLPKPKAIVNTVNLGKSKFDSILIENEGNMKLLASWIPGGNDSQRFVLVFRASRDGWPASTFHSKCDECKATVVIMKGVNGNIFGGYTSVPWDQTYRNWKTDNDAFLYLLKCADGSGSTPAKYKVNSAATAIYAHSSYGPNWGNGPDLEIKSDENIVSDLENASCSFSSPKNNKLFGGSTSRTCKITDYEVFEVV